VSQKQRPSFGNWYIKRTILTFSDKEKIRAEDKTVDAVLEFSLEAKNPLAII